MWLRVRCGSGRRGGERQAVMTLALNTLEHPAGGEETMPPLLIAHGLFGSARNFNTLGRKLATDRRVVMVDMRNHGESPWDDDVRYAAMAEDLAAVIEARCNGHAVVMGHSMGGKAAMALALMRPDLLAGVVVADIAPVAYAHTHLPFVQAMRAMDLSGVTRRSEADPLLAHVITEPTMRSFILQNLVIEGGAASWRLNLAALDAGMPDLIDWPADLAGEYDGPAFFVYGGASEYMGSDRMARVRTLFPGAEFHEIAGAGHWLHAEKPTEFLAAVSGFLGTL